MCDVLLPPGVNPTAVKYIYHIINRQNIPQQKPHILIHDNEEGTCMLIDFAISGDENVTKEGAERTSLPLMMER
jgi:hypothetical protein